MASSSGTDTPTLSAASRSRAASASSYVRAASGFGASLSVFAIQRMNADQSFLRALGNASSTIHLPAVGIFSARPR